MMAESKKNANQDEVRMMFNVNKLSLDSQIMEIGGAKWYLKVEKRVREPNAQGNRGIGPIGGEVWVDAQDFDMHPGFQRRLARNNFLRASVCCIRPSVGVSREADYVIRLAGSKSDLLVKGSHRFEGEELESSAVVDSFMKWSHISDPANGFVDDSNNLMVGMEITIKESASDMKARIGHLFSAATPYSADCVLMVEGKEVHVSKHYLAIHSIVFNEMFEAKSTDAIDLQQLNYSDFVELLAVIYPCYEPITDANVERLLRVADRFKVLNVADQCEIFLKQESNLPLGKRLLLAQQFRLDDLKLTCSKECISVGCLKEMKEDFAQIDQETKCLLLDKLFGL